MIERLSRNRLAFTLAAVAGPAARAVILQAGGFATDTLTGRTASRAMVVLGNGLTSVCTLTFLAATGTVVVKVVAAAAGLSGDSAVGASDHGCEVAFEMPVGYHAIQRDHVIA